MQTTIAYPEITVIRPYGSLNASNTEEFQQQIAAAIAQAGNTSVLVNLEQVESLDSAGLMTLVHGLRLAQSLGKQFKLCCVSPEIWIIFELTQLDQVFEIIDGKAGFEVAIA